MFKNFLKSFFNYYKMAQYNVHKINLSNNQIKRLEKALRKKEGVSIRISYKNLNGEYPLPLTATQMKRVEKGLRNQKGLQLKLSALQVQKIDKKHGGFLPLLALIPAAVGAVSGIAGAIGSIVNGVRQNSEQKRHNQEIEKLAKGSGIVSDALEPFPIIGKPLSLVLRKMGLGVNTCPKKLAGFKLGSGLYLEPYSGNGLHLSPQNN